MSETIESLLVEGRTFPPSAEFVADASSRPRALRRGRRRSRGVLGRGRPRELLDWFEPWHTVLRVGPAVREVVRRRQAERLVQLPRPARRRPATATRSRTTGRASPATPARSPTRELLDDVSRLANALKELGVREGRPGQRSTSGWCPSCRWRCSPARGIGAAHSVVFGGFSADSLRDRINDAEAKVLITGDGAWRRGQIVPLKEIGRRRGRRVPVDREGARAAAHRARRRR